MTTKKKKGTKDNNMPNNVKHLMWRTAALGVLGLFIFNQLFYVTIEPRFNMPSMFMGSDKVSTSKEDSNKNEQLVDIPAVQSVVIPEEGVSLPIVWAETGKKMVKDGVIDEDKFKQLFQDNLTEEQEKILSGEWNDEVVMNLENSRFWLDMLWAFGLANENVILTEGEMVDEKYGGDAGNFASTGGWSLSVGDSMNHYSAHPYVVLTSKQQEMVDRVSRGIYRPCCGNSTHFPDCNHGMAMLGLLQLLAVNDVSEQEMYDVALRVNSYWFPQTYIDLATYFEEQGESWDEVDSKVVLGRDYSSGAGYSATRKKIKSLPTPALGGGGCGV